VREVNAKNKTKNQNILKSYEKYQVVKAAWPPIIDSTIFAEVQRTLAHNQAFERARHNSTDSRTFFLTGILYCQECGRAMMGTSGKGRHKVYRYYMHPREDIGSTCTIKTISADKLEQKVFNHVSEVLFRDGYLDSIEARLKFLFEKTSSEDLREAKTIRADIESRAKCLKRALKKDAPAALIKRQLQQLVEAIIVSENGANIAYSTRDDLNYEIGSTNIPKSDFSNPQNAYFGGLQKSNKLKLHESFQVVPDVIENSKIEVWGGSYVVKNGWGFATTHTPLYFVDFIDLSNFFDATIIKKTAQLREKGLTYKEISQVTGIPKTNIHRVLSSQPESHHPTPASPKKFLNGATPFGYCLFRGSIVEDPKEQKVVQIILSHWQSGDGFETIANTLNQQKQVTKTGTPWTYCAIRSVVRRHLSMNNKPKENS
jgi:hypothetical protein